MAGSKIKISTDSLNIEIEGSDDLIYKIFTDLKNGRFLPPPAPAAEQAEHSRLSLISTGEQTTETAAQPDDEPDRETDDVFTASPATAHLPDLNELILEKRRFTQTEWMILLAWFASHKGKSSFTKKDFRKPYMSISKYTKMRSNQLKSNLISLILNDCIICVEKDVYLMTDTGIERALSLLTTEQSQHQERKLNFAI
ncbi:MAG: hypothetical protein ACI4RB_06125 [Acutalibacteraceae bacterium]